MAAITLLPTVALAHQLGLSHGMYALEGDRLEVTIRMSAQELEGEGQGEGGGARLSDPLVRAVAGTLSARQRSGACAQVEASGRPAPPDGASLSAVFRCPRPGEAAQVELGFLARMPPGHVHLARTSAGGAVQEQVGGARSGAVSVEAHGAWSRAGRFVALGVEHILGGWDHVAFLLALLLAGGGLGATVRVVTSFTVGHAATLALAMTGAVTAPAAIVEPLIAASVVAVAAENLRDLHRGRTGPGRRWPMALGFGLVHGLGFAGALSELALPRAGLAEALVSFNLGVELGQAAIVAVAFPALALARRSARLGRRFPLAGSALVGCAGLVWLVERLAG